MRPIRGALPTIGILCVLGTTHSETQVGNQPTAGVTRAAFAEVIKRPRASLDPSPAKVTTEKGYRQELLSFASEPNERVPVLVLRKDPGPQRRAVAIALHGTNGSKEGMRDWLEAYADRGWLAVSIDARHHGERASPIPGLPNAYQSAMLRAYRTGEGHPYLYDTVWDVLRLLDYLSTRPDVDMTRIGLSGNSKGGTEAYLAGAADERIKVVVPFIGVQGYGWSLRHPSGWEARTWTLRQATEAAAADSGQAVDAAFVKKFYDRIAPGLVDRFDGPAMLPLIAPRPLLVVNGDSDPRSPLSGVKEAVAAAEKAYAVAGVRERFTFLLEPDAAHEITADARAGALKWFERWLSPTTD
ncbi:MAG: acetylxylan esterase [Vicinamibacterales bacterium]